jgi:hypothetical protein
MSFYLNAFEFYPQFLFTPEDEGEGTHAPGGGESGEGSENDGEGTQSNGMINKDDIFGKKGDDPSDDKPNGDDPGEKKPAARPDYIAEKFWDAEKGEPRLESMSKAYSDLEKKLGQGAGKPPKSPEDYQINLENEAIKALFPDGDPLKDPVMKNLTKKLHEKGVSQEVYESVMNVALEAVAENFEENKVPEIDPQAEREKLGKNADAIIKNQTQFLEQMFKQGHVNEEQMREILILTETAEGLQALQAIRNYYGDQQKIPTNLNPGGGVKSKDELMKMQADPKYGSDPEYTATVDKEYEKKYGTGTSGESARSALS